MKKPLMLLMYFIVVTIFGSFTSDAIAQVAYKGNTEVENTTEQVGNLGVYSPKFHGKPTASGEIYDQNKLTCAHRTYAFGTILKVTRLDNQKTVFLKVNDRGPFLYGDIVDVSTKAAMFLGVHEPFPDDLEVLVTKHK